MQLITVKVKGDQCFLSCMLTIFKNRGVDNSELLYSFSWRYFYIPDNNAMQKDFQTLSNISDVGSLMHKYGYELKLMPYTMDQHQVEKSLIQGMPLLIKDIPEQALLAVDIDIETGETLFIKSNSGLQTKKPIKFQLFDKVYQLCKKNSQKKQLSITVNRYEMMRFLTENYGVRFIRIDIPEYLKKEPVFTNEWFVLKCLVSTLGYINQGNEDSSARFVILTECSEGRAYICDPLEDYQGWLDIETLILANAQDGGVGYRLETSDVQTSRKEIFCAAKTYLNQHLSESSMVVGHNALQEATKRIMNQDAIDQRYLQLYYRQIANQYYIIERTVEGLVQYCSEQNTVRIFEISRELINKWIGYRAGLSRFIYKTNYNSYDLCENIKKIIEKEKKFLQLLQTTLGGEYGDI